MHVTNGWHDLFQSYTIMIVLYEYFYIIV